jgi:hypothetical protein
MAASNLRTGASQSAKTARRSGSWVVGSSSLPTICPSCWMPCETQTGKHPAWSIAGSRMAKRSSRYPTLDPSRYLVCFGFDRSLARTRNIGGCCLLKTYRSPLLQRIQAMAPEILYLSLLAHHTCSQVPAPGSSLQLSTSRQPNHAISTRGSREESLAATSCF